MGLAGAEPHLPRVVFVAAGPHPRQRRAVRREVHADALVGVPRAGAAAPAGVHRRRGDARRGGSSHAHRGAVLVDAVPLSVVREPRVPLAALASVAHKRSDPAAPVLAGAGGSCAQAAPAGPRSGGPGHRPREDTHAPGAARSPACAGGPHIQTARPHVLGGHPEQRPRAGAGVRGRGAPRGEHRPEEHRRQHRGAGASRAGPTSAPGGGVFHMHRRTDMHIPTLSSLVGKFWQQAPLRMQHARS